MSKSLRPVDPNPLVHNVSLSYKAVTRNATPTSRKGERLTKDVTPRRVANGDVNSALSQQSTVAMAGDVRSDP